jgi:hypothetical protein
MRTELAVEREMVTLAEQVEIEVGQYRRKPVGILNRPAASRIARAQ